MSGDVQPRKRKDKKKKKDELGIEEPRGTAATLGDGDVFMHSHHEHGTGGHWCAKIIFFSLLAVLIGLIGLIILENRGLSELEANAVESRYSGMLEGWLEDAPDDDHHDEHTLELKNHDDDDHDLLHGHDEHGDDEQSEEEHEENEGSEEQDLEQADDEEEGGFSYSKYFGGGDDDDTAEEDDDDEEEEDDEQNFDDDAHDDDEQNDDEENEENLSNEVDDNEEDNDDIENLSNEVDEQNDDEDYQNDDNDDEDEQNDDNDDEDEQNDDNDEPTGEDLDEFEQNEEQEDSLENEDEDEHDEEADDDDDEIDVEKIEQEPSDEPISTELPALPEEDEDDDQNDDHEDEVDDTDEADNTDEADDLDDDFLDVDEPLPVVERISAPAGKPFAEVEEDEASSERPPDTLEEEEEYEKQQEELRKEEEKSSHMWLKLTIGCALLVATHAVVRRATARDAPERESSTREETPVIDRRMTLIPEEPEPAVSRKVQQQTSKPIVEVKKNTPILKSAPKKQPSEEEEEEEHDEPEEIVAEVEEIEEPQNEDEDKELYSDEEVEEEEIVKEKETPKTSAKTEVQDTKVQQNAGNEDVDDEDVPDDVEIIDDERLEEELEEEEEISDVDDTELLSRLEEKYGRLPEPDRPAQKHKDGGNSIEDEWPGEPADAYWRQELDSAEGELRQGEWSSAVDRASATQLASSARARYIVATALDRMAEAQKDNRLLSRAITAYLHLLKMNENLPDQKIRKISDRTLDRIQFRGNYLSAEPVYRLLIRRFPDVAGYRNNLTISFLMANRADLAEENLKETLRLWPKDRIALAHYAFVLKNQHKKYEEAAKLFENALQGDKGPACEPRFYYHYGDALLLLGRYKEAHEVHKRGAKQGHFLSPAQRSLYNVKGLRGRPWWKVEDTPYVTLARALEKSWKDILKEGEAARALYEQEKEGLKERGDWSQLDLFVRGREISDRCQRAPITCSIVKSEPAAVGCRRGQIKFSSMEPGTHVRPHVGPTNCRLRMHLGLSNTKDTYLRVNQETRQWDEGKVLLFDDSFEHEVWHNGTAKRLVLIVDLWHPDLSPTERRTLPAI